MAQAPHDDGRNNSDVTTAFPLAKGKQLGYRTGQVDAFLARARQAYESESRSVTASQIRNTAFRLSRRGYAARFVDAAMDRLEEVFFERERQAFIAEHGEDAWWNEARTLLSELRGRLKRPHGQRVKRRGLLASGYRTTEVDAFLDRITAMLAGEAALSTSDVRSAVFHTQLRGYDEDQVDRLLDAVVQLMLTVKR